MKVYLLKAATAAAFALFCAGCANGTAGQAAAGILSGIGAGLSGL